MTQNFGFTGVLETQAHSAGYATVFLARLWGQKASQTRVLLNSRPLGTRVRKNTRYCYGVANQ